MPGSKAKSSNVGSSLIPDDVGINARVKGTVVVAPVQRETLSGSIAPPVGLPFTALTQRLTAARVASMNQLQPVLEMLIRGALILAPSTASFPASSNLGESMNESRRVGKHAERVTPGGAVAGAIFGSGAPPIRLWDRDATTLEPRYTAGYRAVISQTPDYSRLTALAVDQMLTWFAYVIHNKDRQLGQLLRVNLTTLMDDIRTFAVEEAMVEKPEPRGARVVLHEDLLNAVSNAVPPPRELLLEVGVFFTTTGDLPVPKST